MPNNAKSLGQGFTVGSSPSSFESYFKVFRDIMRSVHSSSTLKEVLDVVVCKSTGVLNARGALLRVLNEESGLFEVGAACGFGEHYLSKGPVRTEKLIPEPGGLHKVHIISDIWNNPRIEYKQEKWDEGIRMMVDVPLAIKEEMVGLIRIYLSEKREFSEDELDFLLTVAEQCAFIIKRVQLIEKQQAMFNHLATHVDKMSSLGRMAAGVAHEINNPLAGILLFASNMIKKVPKGSPLEQGLSVIINESQRCKKIIHGLLEFGRDQEAQKVLANVNEIMENALILMDNEFRLAHIHVQKDLGEDMPKTLLDVNQVEQVFINILLNAVHAVDEGGSITVKTVSEPAKKRIRVEIADNGCGIAHEDINKIFEPFFSTKTDGTGLGLAVSYGIVKNHQGEIRVFSEPGSGTRFVIDFPILGRNSNPPERTGI